MVHANQEEKTLTIEFNFTGLHPAFLEAVQRHEPSIAFTLTDGIGKFTFLLFMKTDSAGKIVWGQQELFILLARTQGMIRRGLYGNHRAGGDFTVYLTDEHENAIRAELGLGKSATGNAFVLRDFLAKLNGLIPTSIPLEAKTAVIREHRVAIKAHCADYIDKAARVYLLRAGPLADGKRPREETLRKLYMLDASREDVAALIRNLKQIRWTTFWTDKQPTSDKFAEIFAKVAGATSKP
ncbi:hypothetical protein NDK50_00055 [Paraburkholderia bryophila]|uniref:hypothetical protein n=1 Tax=Paraburkholderia bryophila TaxID=420952 RepID=UPI00234AEA93|nr:hypothetical protein [Paraburkholderia bryophila]WCM19918.1 hypothetical protein NDK50_00055 [Paraburkholderia bryophila]